MRLLIPRLDCIIIFAYLVWPDWPRVTTSGCGVLSSQSTVGPSNWDGCGGLLLGLGLLVRLLLNPECRKVSLHRPFKCPKCGVELVDLVRRHQFDRLRSKRIK